MITFADFKILSMHKEWNFEALSWLFILMSCALFLVPVYLKSGVNYPFYLSNALSIIIFLGITRWLFLWKFVPYSRSTCVKWIFIFLPIPVLMYLVGSLWDFQKLIDEEGTISFLKGSSDMRDYDFGRFMKYQFIFFCTGAIVTTALLPVRMIISFWRIINTPDKV